jgi:precorrin-3B synthase
MAALDGLIVRVKPFVRGLSAADLQCIAAAAERAGATGLELTARGALQVRGLDEAGAAMFARTMVEAGLASADAAVERRRNIQLGVGCGASLLSFAGALESWLEQDDSLSALPAKFGFAVSPSDRIAADIVVLGEDESHIVIGGDTAVSVSRALSISALPGRRERGADAMLDAVQRLTRAFLTLAPLQPTPLRRMKGLIQAVGLAVVVAEAGLAPEFINAASSPLPLRSGGESPTVGPCRNGYGLGVVFGVLSPSALRTVAELATRYGDGQVLLAPGRVIWLGGVSPLAQAQLADEASAAGFIVDPLDRRLRLNACVGRAGCARASEDVRAAALGLASVAPVSGLHVSGCAKGCAHPAAAGVTLVSRGAAGRYDLILDGAPSAAATQGDIRLDEVVEHLSEPAL